MTDAASCPFRMAVGRARAARGRGSGMSVFHTRMSVAAGVVFFAIAGVSGAEAAPATPPASAEVSQLANRPITAVAAMAEDDELTNCSRARRRLWVDGEGWIVRRVTTCR